MLKNKTKLLVDGTCLSVQRGGVARILLNFLVYLSEVPNLTIRCVIMNGSVNDLPHYENVEYVALRRPLGMKRFTRAIVENTSLIFQIYKFSPDIVFCPRYTAPLLFKFYKPFRLVTGIWDITYTTHPSHYRLHERIVQQGPSALAAKMSDMVITCSEFDAKQIAEHYAINRHKIHVLTLNADENFFKEAEISNDFNEYLKSKNINCPYYLTLGVIYTRRMIPEIIAAFVRLKKQSRISDNLQLVVVGKNLIRPTFELEDLIEENYQYGVRYIEFIPEEFLKQIFTKSDAYLCISEVDGEAILVKEAAALNTPVITTQMLGEGLNNSVEMIETPVTVEGISKSIFKFYNLDEKEKMRRTKIARSHIEKIDSTNEYKAVIRKMLN